MGTKQISPQKTSENLFSVRVAQASGAEGGKPLFVVSKKVAKTAVARNKIKRKYRHALKEMRIKNNKRIIFYIKEGSLRAKYPTLQSAVAEKLTALGVIKGDKKQ